MNNRREWIIDGILGVVIGGLTGAIVAVNFIITIGIGYDVSIPEIFDHSFLAGVATVAILVAGPIVGVVGIHRLRQKRRRA